MNIFYKYFLLIFLTILISCKRKVSCERLKKDYFFILSDIKSKEDSLKLFNDLNIIIREYPRCLKALELRATMNFGWGNYYESKNDFSKAIIIDSNNVYSYYYLGVIANLEDKNYKSLEYLSKAKKIKDGNGYIINTNNDFSEKLDVKYEEIIYYLGTVFFELNELAAAKRIFKSSEVDNYFMPETFEYLARIYEAEGKIDSACYYYKKAKQEGAKNITIQGCR